MFTEVLSRGTEAKRQASLIRHSQLNSSICTSKETPLSEASGIAHFDKISKSQRKTDFKLNPRKISSDLLKQLGFYKPELFLGHAR